MFAFLGMKRMGLLHSFNKDLLNDWVLGNMWGIEDTTVKRQN